MSSKKCSAFIIDAKTKRNRRCKQNCYISDVCYIHSKGIRSDAAIVIQRFWQGFIKRTKLNNLFYKLPRELQLNVLRYIRYDHYIEKKWIPSVLKVYKNRLYEYVAQRTDLDRRYDAREINLSEFSDQLEVNYELSNIVHDKLDMFLDD